jgi:hypothetical protein
MSIINNNLLLAAEDGGYVIDRSLRFRASASAYLNRTPASAGNRRTWTWSGWVKRGRLGTDIHSFFGTQQGVSDVPRAGLQFESGNTLTFFYNPTGSSSNFLTTAAVFRDVSAWYHIILSVDTTQATASNRLKLYVNGVQVTSFGTANYPSQNADLPINATTQHIIGSFDPTVDVVERRFYDGYLTEVNFIDGQALTPSSFGETNALTGVWQPKKYEGTYGTNGFYLNFSDSTSTTTLTADQSGNGNNWTANNISLTSGATYDSMIDTPTPVADVRGNFCVLNPLAKNSSTSITNGNLSASGNVIFGHTQATMFVNSGKWYFEAQLTTQQNDTALGLGNTASNPFGQFTGGDTNSVGYLSDGRFFYNGSLVATYSSYTTTDVVACAFDCATGKIWIAKNNTWQNSGNPAAGTGQVQTVSWAEFAALARTVGSGAIAFNFGQRPFAYTPPSGFKALHTGNLPEPAIVDGGEYFNTVLYTGNGSNRSVTGVGFQPDWVWLKRRDSSGNHALFDAVRGATKYLESSNTGAEATSATSLTSFDTDGFSLGTETQTNTNGATYVGWNWKANGAGVTNTAGSITSTVSANPTAGFSIVTWTGTQANATVGHGLGAAPRLIIVKFRNGITNWQTYHASVGNTAALKLNTTGTPDTSSVYWNNTTPTSTVFSLGSADETNRSGGAMLAYCFAEVPGYSRFGSYTGNGSADGPFVFCGFRPRYVMCKRTDSTSDWVIYDTARETFNVMGSALYADLSIAELSSPPRIDMLSNGFKLRTTGEPNWASSTVIFMAFAEHPFKLSLAR